MSNENARYDQGMRSLVALFKAGIDAVQKVVVPITPLIVPEIEIHPIGDEFVTLGEDCPRFPGEVVVNGERHLPAIDVLRYLVDNHERR